MCGIKKGHFFAEVVPKLCTILRIIKGIGPVVKCHGDTLTVFVRIPIKYIRNYWKILRKWHK